MRSSACYALRELGPEAREAIPALFRAATEDKRETVRIATMEALEKIQKKRKW